GGEQFADSRRARIEARAGDEQHLPRWVREVLLEEGCRVTAPEVNTRFPAPRVHAAFSSSIRSMSRRSPRMKPPRFKLSPCSRIAIPPSSSRHHWVPTSPCRRRGTTRRPLYATAN